MLTIYLAFNWFL